jgi:hypothetical protein
LWHSASTNYATASERIVVAKSREVKSGSNEAGFSKEGCGSKRASLPMMMILEEQLSPCPTTWRHIAEDTNVCNYRRHNFKSQKEVEFQNYSPLQNAQDETANAH